MRGVSDGSHDAFQGALARISWRPREPLLGSREIYARARAAMSAGRQQDVRSSALRAGSADYLADPRAADPARFRYDAIGCAPLTTARLRSNANSTTGQMPQWLELSDSTHCPHAHRGR